MTKSPGATPTPTLSPTPTDAGNTGGDFRNGLVSSGGYGDDVQQRFDERFIITYNFDGAMTTDQNGRGDQRRAIGWGGDKDTFTWKRWLTLEDAYNPTPGQVNPWSLRAWYTWGARNFWLHSPFGKPTNNGNPSIDCPEQMVYQVDQYLAARDGLTYMDYSGVRGGAASGTGATPRVINTPMKWLTDDFVKVWKTLTTGEKHPDMTAREWKEILEWFDPSQPIKVSVYVGGLADPGTTNNFGGEDYGSYIQRWNDLFTQNASTAAQRLRDSVQPFIECGMDIGFDALCASPGPIGARFGIWIPFSRINQNAQNGWWNFITTTKSLLKDTINGAKKVYCESAPFKKEGMDSPYLGFDIVSMDNWFADSCWATFTPDTAATRPYKTSELSPSGEEIDVLLCPAWGGAEHTPLVSRTDNGVRKWARYAFLASAPEAINTTPQCTPWDLETRLDTAACCVGKHNYYWNHLWPSIIAFHLLEPQYTGNETNRGGVKIKNKILVSPAIRQVLPEAYAGDTRHPMQFGSQFTNAASFVYYVRGRLAAGVDASVSVYDSFTNPGLS